MEIVKAFSITAGVFTGNRFPRVTKEKKNNPYFEYCRCNEGWKGDLCEFEVCFNHCIHGECLTISGQPICDCAQTQFWGDRCEFYKI